MKLHLIAIPLALLAIGTVASRAENLELYGRIEQFTWEEFDEGERLLKEDGQRFGGGIRGILQDFNAWRLGGRLEGIVGAVDYDGQTFGGDPVTDTTDYFGVRAELYGLLFPPSDDVLDIHPIIGLGSRYWIRRLARGMPDRGGYDEGWFTLYAQLGAELQWTLSPTTHLYVRTISRPALYNSTYYSLELDDEETFSLKPGLQSTWELEAGVSAGGLRISCFFETLAFKRSGSRIVPPLEAFQPKSEGTLIGIQLGALW